MAELRIADGLLVLHLTAAEKVESGHGDLRVPLSAVQSIEVIDDAHRQAGTEAGLKVGTRIPGVIEVATIRGLTRKIFAAVHRDTPAACASGWRAPIGTSGSSVALIPRRAPPASRRVRPRSALGVLLRRRGRRGRQARPYRIIYELQDDD